MKPRIRKIEGFWHCVAPDAQGIGITPYDAYREYMDLMLDVIQARIEKSRAESARKEIEYQMEIATINHRTLMAAYGFETDEAGNVVRDYWAEAMTSVPAVMKGSTEIVTLPQKPAPRWWEFWK